MDHNNIISSVKQEEACHITGIKSDAVLTSSTPLNQTYSIQPTPTSSTKSKPLSCGQVVIMLQALADVNRNPEFRKMDERMKKSQTWEDLYNYVRTIHEVTYISRNGTAQKEEGIVWNDSINAKRLRQSWFDMKKGYKSKLLSDPLAQENAVGTVAQLASRIYHMEEGVIEKRRALRKPSSHKFLKDSDVILNHKVMKPGSDSDDVSAELGQTPTKSLIESLTSLQEQINSLVSQHEREREEDRSNVLEQQVKNDEFLSFQRNHLDVFRTEMASMREQNESLISVIGDLVKALGKK